MNPVFGAATWRACVGVLVRWAFRNAPSQRALVEGGGFAFLCASLRAALGAHAAAAQRAATAQRAAAAARAAHAAAAAARRDRGHLSIGETSSHSSQSARADRARMRARAAALAAREAAREAAGEARLSMRCCRLMLEVRSRDAI